MVFSFSAVCVQRCGYRPRRKRHVKTAAPRPGCFQIIYYPRRRADRKALARIVRIIRVAGGG
jgi:hypothetical protein